MFGNNNDDIRRSTVTANELFNYGRDDLHVLDLPELGGVVYLRDLSAHEVLEFGTLSDSDTTAAERAAAQNELMARAIVNENGARIVPVGEEDRLGDLPLKLYMRILNAVTEGMSEVTGVDVTADMEDNTTLGTLPGPGSAEG